MTLSEREYELMKLSEKIRYETRYSVYLKWADEAEQLEAERAEYRAWWVQERDERRELEALLIRLRNFVIKAEGHWLYGEQWTNWIDKHLPKEKLVD